MTDLIDRQEAIEALKRVAGVGNRALEKLRDLPSAHRLADEWCTDCSEYDTERKCCPRFNRVIRSAVDERKRGRWIDLRQEGDSRFMCSVCKWKEHVPTCMGKPTVWEYCPSCGAKMERET